MNKRTVVNETIFYPHNGLSAFYVPAGTEVDEYEIVNSWRAVGLYYPGLPKLTGYTIGSVPEGDLSMSKLAEDARVMNESGIKVEEIAIPPCHCGSRRSAVGFLPPRTLKLVCTNPQCTDFKRTVPIEFRLAPQ